MSNERKYGKEARAAYGDDVIDQSNEMIKNMTRKQHEKAIALSQALMEKLTEAKAQGDPGGALAQEAADLHRQWLSFYWPKYSKEAHAGLARMYVDDERFTAYYDKQGPGTAQFLRDAILIYTQLDR
ncbi:TipAS antibiotic-recognition domain-containing protein [Mesotoga sp.]|uniref:TipAS antibiotic-recognition domain-containing protein n=1 Tax=Mesotoga sp. TaxID=2053577 RepID=UPI00345E4463